MGNDLKSALIQANLVTQEHAKYMQEKDELLRLHAKRQMEMRRNVTLLEATLSHNGAVRNRFSQRLAYIRWYLAQALPKNLADLCFFCGEEGIDEYTFKEEMASMEIACTLLGLSPSRKNLELSAVKEKKLTPVTQYLSLIECPEDIVDFCYGLHMQACGACYAYSSFLSS
jgi:hypothetical protein